MLLMLGPRASGMVLLFAGDFLQNMIYFLDLPRTPGIIVDFRALFLKQQKATIIQTFWKRQNTNGEK